MADLAVLKFHQAYSKAYQLEDVAHPEVVERINKEMSEWCQYYDITEDEFVETFLKYFNAVEKYGMWTEVHMSMASGLTFYQAVEDWDLLD